MKPKNHIMLCMAVTTMCLLASCTQQNVPSPGDVLDKMGICVVKLSSPEYLDYVIADIYNHKDSTFAIRHLIGGAAQELYLGSSPYIAKLQNGYYVVDWKWGDFLYPSTNHLLNVKWEDVKARNQQWEWDKMMLSSGFIIKCGGAPFERIDKYLNIAPPPIKDNTYFDYLPREYCRPPCIGLVLSLSEISDSTSLQLYLDDVKYQDSLQTIYIERLEKLIEEGKFEEALYHLK